MLDPQTLFSTNVELIDAEHLKGLHLIMGFTGFAEAGHVVSQISDELLNSLDSELVAAFDVDQLIDYRSRRPQITFAGDHLADYQAPKLNLYLVRDALQKPFLLLTGVEPDFQWERFARAVVALVQRLDVNLVSWVHSIPMPVPHTRPLGVTVHGNRSELIDGITTWRPTAELRSSVGHLLEMRLNEAERNVVGYVVHVPHYLAEAEYPPAAVTGLEHLGTASALMLPTERLRETGRDVERQIAEQVASSSDVQSVVANLEAKYDEHHQEQQEAPKSLLGGSDDELPDAETIGAAVEAYLASRETQQESGEGSSPADTSAWRDDSDETDTGSS